MQQVTANVYVETGIPACNTGIVTTKAGIVMIDTPWRPTDAVKWRDEISKMGEIKYIINTEEHPDHFCGTWYFPGSLISHRETREKLSKFPAETFINIVKRADPDGLPLMNGLELRLADMTFTGQLELFLDSHTIRLFSLPGHSTGGIGVYIPEERVVFATDIIFNKKKSWLHESVPSDWLESLKKIKELDVDTIVPGHGDVCKKDYLDEQAAIIQRWIEAVQSAIKQGLSVDEAAEHIAPPDPNPLQPGTPFSEADLHKMTVARLYQLYSK